MRFGYRVAMRAAGTAGFGAGAERLVDDGLDGPRAATAFGAATKAAIDLLGIARQIIRGADGAADIVIGQDVTGANNHSNGSAQSGAEPFDIQDRIGMQKEKLSFQAIPN
jgi:hypothetical protein